MAPTSPLSSYVMISWVQGGEQEGRRRGEGGEKEGRRRGEGGEKEGRRRGEGGEGWEKLNSMRDAGDVRREI